MKNTLIQIQDRAIERLLAIPEITRRGSGALQSRMRAGARKEYERNASRLGFNADQIAEQWKQVNEMVELEKGAN